MKDNVNKVEPILNGIA